MVPGWLMFHVKHCLHRPAPWLVLIFDFVNSETWEGFTPQFCSASRRYDNASAICGLSTVGAPARSAMVRATRSTRL